MLYRVLAGERWALANSTAWDFRFRIARFGISRLNAENGNTEGGTALSLKLLISLVSACGRQIFCNFEVWRSQSKRLINDFGIAIGRGPVLLIESRKFLTSTFRQLFLFSVFSR